MVKSTYTYKQYRPNIKSFGYLNCVDKITLNPKSWFWALIGHTARTYVDTDTGIVYVYEATTLNDGTRGTQIMLMSDWIKRRNRCNVFYRQPQFYNKDRELICQWLFKEHINRYRGTPYPDLSQWRWRWHMINAAVDLGIKPLENKDQDEMMHCTQLAVHLDRYCGIIRAGVNPAEWEPDDCRDGRKLDYELGLGHVMKLYQEVRLVYE
jgi:hypothetical protein